MIRKIITDREDLIIPTLTVTTEDISTTVQDLLDTARSQPTAGLAAPQIGALLSVIVVKINNHFVPMVNPAYQLRNGGFLSKMESCLSFPGEWVKVRRYKKVCITYHDPINNTLVILRLKGWEARTVQHEMDHLKGKVII